MSEIMKICSKCKVFGKFTLATEVWCQKCRRASSLAKYKAKKLGEDPKWMSTADRRSLCEKYGIKKCTGCAAFKPVDKFPKQANAIGGRNPKCRVCMKEYRRLRKERLAQRQNGDET